MEKEYKVVKLATIVGKKDVEGKQYITVGKSYDLMAVRGICDSYYFINDRNYDHCVSKKFLDAHFDHDIKFMF